MNEMWFHKKRKIKVDALHAGFEEFADTGTRAVKQASLGSSAHLSNWLQVILIVMMSASRSRCQVFGELCQLPCGFHVRACLLVLLAGFRIVFPIRPYRRFWISWPESWMLVVANLQPLSVVKLSGFKTKMTLY